MFPGSPSPFLTFLQAFEFYQEYMYISYLSCYSILLILYMKNLHACEKVLEKERKSLVVRLPRQQCILTG